MGSVGSFLFFFFFVYSLRANLFLSLLTAGVRMLMQSSKSIKRLDRWRSRRFCCTRYSKNSRSCSRDAIRCAAAGAPARQGLTQEHASGSFATSHRGAGSCTCGRNRCCASRVAFVS